MCKVCQNMKQKDGQCSTYIINGTQHQRSEPPTVTMTYIINGTQHQRSEPPTVTMTYIIKGTQHQRSEPPTVTMARHASKARTLHQRCICQKHLQYHAS